MRALMSAALGLMLLAGMTPAGTLSVVQMCRRACCAGALPHEDGSCAGGSCHANLSAKQKTRRADAEKLCGVRALLAAHRGETGVLTARATDSSTHPHHSATGGAERAHHAPVSSTGNRRAAQGATSTPVVNSKSLAQPCPSDCGMGAVSSATHQRQRDAAGLSYSDKPRPPSVVRLPRSSFKRFAALSALGRTSRPRAPPSVS